MIYIAYFLMFLILWHGAINVLISLKAFFIAKIIFSLPFIALSLLVSLVAFTIVFYTILRLIDFIKGGL